MPEKDTALYTCPAKDCKQRVRILERRGRWYWDNHQLPDSATWCSNSGRRVTKTVT